jgi:hypothetical protein
MTASTPENQANNPPPEQKISDKELNFRRLEQTYEQRLAQERAEKEQLRKELEERSKAPVDDDDDGEPYIDKKKLNKTLNRYDQQAKQETKTEIQRAVQDALINERRQNWIKNNPDFYEVLKHADKFAEHDPELAETILEMPEGFERQKLVYNNIKALGIHQPAKPAQTIQEKVDANRKSPYYQPSGVGTAPYAQVGDFSATGQKQAYEKMQALKKMMRL